MINEHKPKSQWNEKKEIEESFTEATRSRLYDGCRHYSAGDDPLNKLPDEVYEHFGGDGFSIVSLEEYEEEYSQDYNKHPTPIENVRKIIDGECIYKYSDVYPRSAKWMEAWGQKANYGRTLSPTQHIYECGEMKSQFDGNDDYRDIDKKTKVRSV